VRSLLRAAACAFAVISAPSFAQEAEQQGPLFFYDVPIHWIEPAHRALEQFRTRHRDNLDCFTVSFHQEEDGGFSVSFAPKTTITRDGEAITLSHPTTCGFGETFQYGADGEFVRHTYMRH
jgi:hypothetical protein